MSRLVGVSIIGLIGFAAWLPCAAQDSSDWRLVALSAKAGLSVFSDSRSRIATYEVGDGVAGGRWLVASIAGDHVVLEPRGSGAAGKASAAVVLEVGESLPDVSRLQPRTPVYYELRGTIIDGLDDQADAGDGEPRP